MKRSPMQGGLLLVLAWATGHACGVAPEPSATQVEAVDIEQRATQVEAVDIEPRATQVEEAPVVSTPEAEPRATEVEEAPVVSTPEAEPLDWRLGVQAWSFNRFTFYETVDKAAAMGLKYIEAFPGQRLSKEKPDVRMGPGLGAADRQEVKRKLEAAGVRLVCFGVTGAGNEAGWRKLFAFCKDMGVETITSEPNPSQMEMIDGLCGEFRINLAIHNHPKPSRYWNPDKVLEAVEGRSERVGACADTGHWSRSGLVPVECLRKLEGRVISLHFKDLNRKGGGHDVPWGTGVCGVRWMLAELARQEFSGVFSIEYEHNWANSMPDIEKCIAYFNQVKAELDEAGKDGTPPSEPGGFTAEALSPSEVRLSWEPAEDPESGVAFYRVYCNGKEVGTVSGTEFEHSGLVEASTWRYEVAAVNLGMKESARAIAQVRTLPDTTPPEVAAVGASGLRTRVTVAFTEPVEAASASDAANYSVSGGVTVLSARLMRDGRALLLATTELDDETQYALTVQGVRDRAKRPNVIADGTRVSFRYVETGDGLLGSYFRNGRFEGEPVERVDARVDFDWEGGAPLADFPADDFTVRWTGHIRAGRGGGYALHVTTDDGVRVWIDGRKVIDDWQDRGPTESKAAVTLAEGVLHAIRIEYYEKGGGAVARLEWSGPGVPRQVVPKENLYPAAPIGVPGTRP